jgi:hypothetical protein
LRISTRLQPKPIWWKSRAWAYLGEGKYGRISFVQYTPNLGILIVAVGWKRNLWGGNDMRSIFFLLICGMLVGGCQTATGVNGKGPITLSWQSMAKFGIYENEWAPTYFVLSDDGKSSNYSYCPEAYKDCFDGGAVTTVENCNRSVEERGAKCFLFASDQQIV